MTRDIALLCLRAGIIGGRIRMLLNDGEADRYMQKHINELTEEMLQGVIDKAVADGAPREAFDLSKDLAYLYGVQILDSRGRG